ncbi:MAG: thiol:disulfide interchange protein DsbA/DsbL [Pseudomonadales bacterium]
MSNRQSRQVTRTRNTIIAFVALVAIIVIGYGTLYSTGVTEGEFAEGEHYRVIEDAKPRRPGAPIEVREFFSYGCIHCRNFDPLIEEWLQTLPADVRFERSPVVFSPMWTLLAQTYFALDALGALAENHQRLFRAIHDNGRQFLSADMLADFVDGHGVTREQFLEAFNSAPVRRKVGATEQLQRELGIASVPTLVVDDRYVVGMDVGRKTALDVVNHLIELERNSAPGSAAAAD